MSPPLVICYGNVARGDDGVAHRVAGLLGGHPELRVLAVPLLDVGLAAEVAAAPLVVFVDAQRRDAPAVLTTPVEPAPAEPASPHAFTPGALTGLAASLYGAAPVDRFLVSVAAPEMGHGEGLSPTAEAASHEAASEVLSLCGALR